MLYRLTLLSGRVFGADGTDQAKHGMPVPPVDLLQIGKYWLTRPGWEVSASWLQERSSSEIAIEPELANDPQEEDVLYRDIFQVIVRNSSSQKPRKTKKKRKKL